MELGNCDVCGSSYKQIPAGISKKTNKPYQAFIACSKFGCPGKPNMAKNAPVAQISPNYVPEKVNWDKISFGKCKHAYLLKAFELHLRGELKITADLVEKESESWAKMSMRVLKEPEMKDFGNGEELDQVPF